MGKTYTSTIDVRCWKEHTCAGCGTPYSYELIRKVSGSAPTAEKATVNARAAVERTLKSDVDLEPCPICGLYQPDMVAKRRAKVAKLTFWLALLALGLVLILRATDVLQANTATWAAAAVCAAAAIALAKVDMQNPNANPEANRRRAAERVNSGAIRTPRAGPPTEPPDELARPVRSSTGWLAVALLPAAVVAASLPEIMRSSHGWPLNDACYPPVVGPGDHTRVYLPEKIHSIKGYWRGRPYVTATPPGAASIPVPAKANQNDWGSSISAKSSEKDSSSSPWVEIDLPQLESLAGKPVQCDINMQVQYPHAFGSSSFQTQTDNMHHAVALAMAPAGAGERYNHAWWEGTLIAMGAIAAASILTGLRARALRRQATPTRVYNTPEQAPPAPAP
jgi:hypothetical protein